jgi:hypothetical protein
MENSSFCRRVIEAANARPDKVAMTLVGPGGVETTTFGEMLSQIRGVAYRLIQERIALGDRVALIGENHPHWAIAYLAFSIAARSSRRSIRPRTPKRWPISLTTPKRSWRSFPLRRSTSSERSAKGWAAEFRP